VTLVSPLKAQPQAVALAACILSFRPDVGSGHVGPSSLAHDPRLERHHERDLRSVRREVDLDSLGEVRNPRELGDRSSNQAIRIAAAVPVFVEGAA
jgi:hypothetical protein